MRPLVVQALVLFAVRALHAHEHARPCPATVTTRKLSVGDVGALTSTHWMRRASPFLNGPLRKAALTMARSAASRPKGTLPPLPSTSDLLRRAGRLNDAYNCIYRVEYRSQKQAFFADHRNASQCTKFSGIAGPVLLRAETFVRLLTHLVDSGRLNGVGLDPASDFEFYVDVTDATPVDPVLFMALGRPLLSQSHSPLAGDRYTLPYPDHHQILGMAAEAGYSVPPELQGAANSLADRYAGLNALETYWIDKRDAAIHRAQCVTTYGATLNAGGGLRLVPVRGRVCQHAQDTTNGDFDVGTSTSHDTPSTLAGMCAACNDKQFMDWRQMATGWRYIINSDGYGMSYDGTFWKLASNSTVFWLASGSADTRGVHRFKSTSKRFGHAAASTPYWQAWYSALLQPWCHYVPVEVDGLQQALDWCRRNESVCSDIADRGARTVRTLVSPNTMLDHLAHTLVGVQLWQRATVEQWLDGVGSTPLL